MDRATLKASLLAMHDHPQNAAQVSLGINTVFEGLDMLRKYGHDLKVDYLDPLVSGPEWPKMLYHDGAAPGGRVFHREEDVPTEPGWRATPLEAQPETEADAPKSMNEDLDSRHDGREGEHPERPTSTIQTGPASRDATFPKRLFHPMFPGGLKVDNSETEATFKGQGWKDEPEPGTDGRGYHGSEAHAAEAKYTADNAPKVKAGSYEEAEAKAVDRTPNGAKGVEDAQGIHANSLAHPEVAPDAKVEPVGGNTKAGEAKLKARSDLGDDEKLDD